MHEVAVERYTASLFSPTPLISSYLAFGKTHQGVILSSKHCTTGIVVIVNLYQNLFCHQTQFCLPSLISIISKIIQGSDILRQIEMHRQTNLMISLSCIGKLHLTPILLSQTLVRARPDQISLFFQPAKI